MLNVLINVALVFVILIVASLITATLPVWLPGTIGRIMQFITMPFAIVLALYFVRPPKSSDS